MTLSMRAIDWNRRQRARCGARGNDRRHQWFPGDFRVSFFAPPCCDVELLCVCDFRHKLVSPGQPVRGVHQESQICDKNHKFDTSLASFSVFCVEFSNNFCATQTQQEFWDRSIVRASQKPQHTPPKNLENGQTATVQPPPPWLYLAITWPKIIPQKMLSNRSTCHERAHHLAARRGVARQIYHSMASLLHC